MDGVFVVMHGVNVMLIVIGVVELVMSMMVTMIFSLIMSGFLIMRLISMFMLIRGNVSSMNAIIVVVLVIQLVMSGVTITVEVVGSLIIVDWINNVLSTIFIVVLRLRVPSFLVTIRLLVMHYWICSCDSFVLYRCDMMLSWRTVYWSGFLIRINFLLLFGYCLLLGWLRLFLLLLWAALFSFEVVKILLPVIIGLLYIFIYLLILCHGRLVNYVFISMAIGLSVRLTVSMVRFMLSSVSLYVMGLSIVSHVLITIFVSIEMLTMFLNHMINIMVAMVVRVHYVIVSLLNLSNFALMLKNVTLLLTQKLFLFFVHFPRFFFLMSEEEGLNFEVFMMKL